MPRVPQFVFSPLLVPQVTVFVNAGHVEMVKAMLKGITPECLAIRSWIHRPEISAFTLHRYGTDAFLPEKRTLLWHLVPPYFYSENVRHSHFWGKTRDNRGEICCAYFAHILQFSGKTCQNNRLRLNIFGPPKVWTPPKTKNFRKKIKKVPWGYLKWSEFLSDQNIIIFCCKSPWVRYGVADPTPFVGLRIFCAYLCIFCAYFGLAPSAYFPPPRGIWTHSDPLRNVR